jgi:hypothetical protein
MSEKDVPGSDLVRGRTSSRLNGYTLVVVAAAAAAIAMNIRVNPPFPPRQGASVTSVHYSIAYEDAKQANETLLAFNQRLYPGRKLADECYHVFLDVGANIGVHTRFLLEAGLYPKARHAKDYFNQVFGHNISARDPRDFCSFAFEPNPAHLARFHDFKTAYDAMGWNFMHIAAGVSDREGNISFYHVDKGKNSEWGFRAMPCVPDPRWECREEVLPVIRLAEWIDEHINQRMLPAQVYGNYSAIGPQVGK